MRTPMPILLNCFNYRDDGAEIPENEMRSFKVEGFSGLPSLKRLLYQIQEVKDHKERLFSRNGAQVINLVCVVM